MTSNIHDERDAEMDTLQDEVTRLRAEFNSEALLVTRYKRERDEAQTNARQLGDRLEELSARLATVERERDEARDSLADQVKARMSAERERDAATKRAEAAEAERDEARALKVPPTADELGDAKSEAMVARIECDAAQLRARGLERLIGDETEAYESLERRFDALRWQIEREGCVASREGETTYECGAEHPCGLCRLRGERNTLRAQLERARGAWRKLRPLLGRDAQFPALDAALAEPVPAPAQLQSPIITRAAPTSGPGEAPPRLTQGQVRESLKRGAEEARHMAKHIAPVFQQPGTLGSAAPPPPKGEAPEEKPAQPSAVDRLQALLDEAGLTPRIDLAALERMSTSRRRQYTAADLAQARREALEKAAQVADTHAARHRINNRGTSEWACRDVANELRALAGTPDATKEETT